MQNVFQIGIPTINRCDLLNVAVLEYADRFPNTKIHVWDNGVMQNINPHPNVTISRSESNLGVSGGWNKICNLVYREADYALILNDDVLLKCSEGNILELIAKNKFYFALGSGFDSFLIHKDTFRLVGDFDEAFYPAYYEDNDYYRRLILAKVNVLRDSILTPFIVERSGSIKKNPSLNKITVLDKRYYIEKWGGIPSEEIYLTPFNK